MLFQDEIHGSLFTQVNETMDRLLNKYLKALISYEGIQRVETYPVPEEALREAVLNAVMHKDYGSGVPIQISVYDDKIMFWNNGELFQGWTVETLLRKHSSQPFNPDVANTFFRAGMIEAWGRGIERMMDACQAAYVPVPLLRYETGGLWVKFPIAVAYQLNRIRVETTQETTQERILRPAHRGGQPNRSLYDNNKAVYSLLRYGVPAEIEAGKITDRNWPRSRPNV